MIVSRTYNAVVGTNYIQNAELAFAVIYVVKREGTQHDEYLSGTSNRKFIYSSSEGKITFPIVFDVPGKVFVLFKMTGIEPVTPPGLCVAGAFAGDSALPDGLVGVSYYKLVSLSGTPPFVLSGITKPAWMTISNSGSDIIFSGVPDVTGSVSVAYTVNNCTADALPFSQNIYIGSVVTPNLYLHQEAAGVSIVSLLGIPYTLITGTFPVTYGNVVEASHPAFTGIISLDLEGITFPVGARIFVNATPIEDVPVYLDGFVDFTSAAYLSTDLIRIDIRSL